MRLVPGHIHKLKRLEKVRLNLIEAQQKIGPVASEITVGEEYTEIQCILKDWINRIESDMNTIEVYLEKAIWQTNIEIKKG